MISIYSGHRCSITVIDIRTFFLYGKLGANDKLFMKQPTGIRRVRKPEVIIYFCLKAAY